MRHFGKLSVAVLLLGMLATGARANSLTRASISLDATNPSALQMSHEITVEAGESLGSIDLYVHRAVTIESARMNGNAVGLTSRALDGTELKRWTIEASLASGDEGTISYDAKVASGSGSGVSVSSEGGFLLPGAGWFPRLSPEANERVVHAVSFELPSGMVGIAAGANAAGSWSSAVASRPFAVWGEYTKSEVTAPDAARGEAASFSVYRRPGSKGDVPRLEMVSSAVAAFEIGLGEGAGEGPWKLVDVGSDVLAGGLRTLLWDEKRSAETGSGEAGALYERDVAGALVGSFWNETFTCRGELAAWISHGLARYLGDVTYVALDPSDDRVAVETMLLHDRRSKFVDGLESDRPLKGLVPGSPAAEELLDGRGALVGHLAGEMVQSRSRVVELLRSLRSEFDGASVDWATFEGMVKSKITAPIDHLEAFLVTTDLPDFRIESHGPSEKRKGRYRVEVKNRGLVEAPVDVATYRSSGRLHHEFRLHLGPGESRAILFQDGERIAKIVVDPRGVTPQADLSDEVVELAGAEVDEPMAPAFPFSGSMSSMKRVEGLSLDLAGASISDFTGDVIWYATYHGPSGACLLGNGNVTIAPDGSLGAAFTEAMGKSSLSFRQAGEIWIRFPPSKWGDVEAQLGAQSTLSKDERMGRVRYIYDHSFPTYFAQANLAEVPPDGGSLVVFNIPGGERRGFVRQPLPDGRVLARLWDHISGKTIWEEVR